MEKTYLPLSFAKQNDQIILQDLLRMNQAAEEIPDLTPENILHLAHDRNFFTLRYQGPLAKLNQCIMRCVTNQTYANHNMRAEWKDILSMNAVISLWSRNKQVYQVDPEFAMELAQTKGIRLYPSMLRHLPYNTFYLDFSNIPIFRPFDGMFAHIEVKDNDDVLLIGHRLVGQIYYTCSSELGERVRRYENQGISYYDFAADNLVYQDQVPLSPFLQKRMKNQVLSNQAFVGIWMFYIQFLMYLASKEPDIDENAGTKKSYRPSSTIKNRYSEIRKWDVGVRYGSQIRLFNSPKKQDPTTGYDQEDPANEENKLRKPPRPHTRCAHWQLYWTGKGRTVPEVKWIAPSFVNPRGEMPATIRMVKKETTA